MKKTNLIIGMSAVLLAMASCTNDEPISSESAKTTGSQISFRPAMRSKTRATETTNANLSKFDVTAIWDNEVYFNQVPFAKGADSFFTSSPAYNWPGDDNDVTFYAFAPSAEDLGADITLNTTTKEMASFSPASEVADQVDFITAVATGNRKNNEASGVELNFKHQLSQIELRAKSENTTYTFKVIGMRIGRAEYLGSFDFEKEAWTLDDWHDTEVYTSSCDTVTLSSDPVTIMGASGNAMLLPQTLTAWSPTNDPDNVARGAYLGVLLSVVTKDGAQVYPFPSETTTTNKALRTYGWAAIPLSGTWEAGKKYIYTLDFTGGAGFVDPDDPNPGKPILGGPMKFTINVEDWVDAPQPTSMTTFGEN